MERQIPVIQETREQEIPIIQERSEQMIQVLPEAFVSGGTITTLPYQEVINILDLDTGIYNIEIPSTETNLPFIGVYNEEEYNTIEWGLGLISVNKTTFAGMEVVSYEFVNSADGATNVSGYVVKEGQNISGYYFYINQNELDKKQNEITSNNKLASDLVNDTNQTNKFVTTQEKTTWNNKADIGFTGIISGTSANPTDGATLPNGVYKASEDHISSYISLPMEDGTTKKQSIQKGGIVIRTTARLLIFATQNLMYQYDVAQHFFYPAEPFVESTLRREFVDGIADLGTISPPNTYYLTLPISYLAATINTGDTGHTRITFTVADEIASGDFELYLTDTEGNGLIYTDGATPKPVTGETWIFEIYGNTCEPICFKTTDGKSREDLLKQFMRRNSDQIYYPSLDGKPNFSVQKAAGNSDDPDRKVVITPSDVTLTNYQGLGYYGIDDTKIPLDLSLYDVSLTAKQLHPYTQLPDGVYVVTKKGRLRLDAGEIQNYTAQPGEIIYKDDTELIIIGYYAATYFSWNKTDEAYEGGYFTTATDVEYMLEDYKKGFTINKSSTANGTIAMNDHRWTRKTRESGVNAVTLNYPNTTTIEDNYEARATLITSSSFTTGTITNRSYSIRHIGDDCVNGVLTMVAGKYYDIEAKADGFGGIVGIVHSYTLPTT